MAQDSNSQVGLIIKAVKFAAEKHKFQRRKDLHASPYINHPIDVADLLCNVAGVTDADILIAALLHDTIEDTETTADELKREFGERVTSLVLECTDDKSLPKAERKSLQVQHAPHTSEGAKLIKIADKTSNIRDITDSSPPNWSLQRRDEYLDWSEAVVKGLSGVSPELEQLYYQYLKRGKQAIEEERKKTEVGC